MNYDTLLHDDDDDEEEQQVQFFISLSLVSKNYVVFIWKSSYFSKSAFICAE